MKLIKKLPLKYINGRCVSYAIFWCDFCKSEVEKRLNHGLSNKSCGCVQHTKNNKNYKHGESDSKLYKILEGMKQRCSDINNKYYGGKSITICPEWADKNNGFINFRNWSLNHEYKEGLQIDRINNNGNYEPSNYQWLTRTENNRKQQQVILTLEKANEIRIKYNSDYYTQKQLAKEYNVSRQLISAIIINKIWI